MAVSKTSVVFPLLTLLVLCFYAYNPVAKFSVSKFSNPPYMNIVTLPDGRRLAHAEYGAPEGFPIFVLQSFMQARIGHSPELYAVNMRHNARILVVDRPGYGGSDPAPLGYTSLKFAHDLDYLATVLNISEYGLVGISAGGVYAMAAVHELPATRLRAAVLLSPAPPDLYQGDPGTECFHPVLDPLRTLGYYAPLASRLVMQALRWWIFFWYPELAFPAENMEWAFTKIELRHFISEGIWDTFCNATLEAFRPGVEGILNDVRQISAYWPFHLNELNSNENRTRNVMIFHGSKDTIVPVGCAHYYASTIPHVRQTLIYEHSGHGMMANTTVWDDVLSHIMSSVA